MFLNKLRSFPGAVFRMFETTFPFHNSPSFIIILRQLAENSFKIHLPITGGTVTAGTVEPALITTKRSLFTGRIKFRILYMERLYSFMIEIDVLDIIQLLQYKMRRIV